MELQKFTKRPITIEAMQWDGSQESAHDIMMWVHDNGVTSVAYNAFEKLILIPTLEGVMEAKPQWWVIKGIAGEMYPCDPDIFAKTYNEADDLALTPEEKIKAAIGEFENLIAEDWVMVDINGERRKAVYTDDVRSIIDEELL